MKKFLLITAALWVAVALVWAPAVSGNGAAIAISVTPATVDFGSILPGGDVIGADLTITNSGGVAIIVTAEIVDDTSGFYTEYLYLDDFLVEDWVAPVASASSITVSPQLNGVPPYKSPGNYSCTVIFWAEEATP